MRKLRAYRKAARLSQSELAARVGVSREHITRLENGSTQGSVTLWLEIQSALKLSSKALLDAMEGDDK